MEKKRFSTTSLSNCVQCIPAYYTTYHNTPILVRFYDGFKMVKNLQLLTISYIDSLNYILSFIYQ